MRYYGVDLLDLYRGKVSPRRVAALILGLPPGSSFHRMRGGSSFWSDEVTAIKQVGHRIESTIIAANGGHQRPKEPEPPPVGWRVDAMKRDARMAARLRRFQARQKARRSAAGTGGP